jgi:CubicO group peptidase (beta-lactamase class C family)
MRLLTVLAVAAAAAAVPAAAVDPAKFAPVDAAVEAAIKKGGCPGAVVLVVHDDRVVFRKAYGNRAVQPAAEPMTPDTVFDLASLTKPVATATAIHLLAEGGKLRYTDPVAAHWPAFGANGKEKVTVAHCLLHTSGLIADNPVGDYADGKDKALERVAALKLVTPPGEKFVYSDVGFIVLGHLVEKLGGMPVDEFAKKHVFDPLKMTDTRFRPGWDLAARVAPTGKRDGTVIRAAVHDPRAHRMGGVAGHAGLFGTADDLARFCRMLLRGGELDGVRVLKPETVEAFITPHRVPAGKNPASTRELSRSYGWDVDTGFTAQRGELFPRGKGYGHTGFTGTSVWVDRETKTAVVVLTNRVHPDDKGNVTELRRQVGTIAAEAVGVKK